MFSDHPVHDRRGNGEPVAAVELGVPLDEVVGQDRDLLHPLAQRRHDDVDDVEAVIEILAEPAFGHCPLEVLVGGGQHPHVGVQGRLAADARELAILQHVQQLGLERGVQIADLVQEDGAAMGRLELADLELMGAGEGPAFIAEQLALEELPRHGRAVDLHVRAATPGGEMVDRARHEVLAGAGLARGEHRDVDPRRLPEDPAGLQHPRAAPELHFALDAGGRRLRRQARRFQRHAHQGIERLLEIVEHQGLSEDGLEGERHGGRALVGAVHDADDRPGISALDLERLQQIGGLGAVAGEVDEGEGEGSVRDRLERLPGGSRDALIAPGLKEFQKWLSCHPIDIDNQRSWLSHRRVTKVRQTTYQPSALCEKDYMCWIFRREFT